MGAEASAGRNRRATAIILIAVGWMIVLPAGGYLVYASEVQNPDAVELPLELVDIPLRSAVYGEEAIADVTRLHGQQFSLTSGGVGSYGERGEIALWVTGSITNFFAKKLINDMEESITQSDSPFVPIGKSELDGRTIYQLEGMGQKHFYFQAGNLVVWLAADPDQAGCALASVLDFYP